MDKNNVQSLFEQLKGSYLRNKVASSSPLLLYSGDSPPQKSSLVQVALKKSIVLCINGDEYREHHPRFKKLEKSPHHLFLRDTNVL